jgi:hypothetical protein
LSTTSTDSVDVPVFAGLSSFDVSGAPRLFGVGAPGSGGVLSSPFLSLASGRVAASAAADARRAVSRSPLPRLPRVPLPGFTAAGVSGGSGGVLLAFAVLLFGLLLVIPGAVRWLRPALALGWSPAYVAVGDRPG